MTTTWNPDRYLKFADARLRPALDLLGRVAVERPGVVYDLGCGTGNVTRILAERWPRADVTGVDASPEMLAKARLDGGERIAWVEADLSRWRGKGRADVIFSNAALHWLGDHETLFPALMEMLASGGWLAVQMPRNFLAPSHTAIHEAAGAGPWRQVLTPLLGPPPVGDPGFYFSLLDPLAADIDIWETEYLHVLDGPDPVVEWTRGTWLKRFLDALAGNEDWRDGFLADYAARLRIAYPPLADGRTLFPFRRLFMVAGKRT